MEPDSGLVRSDLTYLFVFGPTYRKDFLFAGWVKSVSSTNIEGLFDVLPLHENFVTLVRDKVSFIDEKGQAREFALERGLLQACGNAVRVFLEF